MNAFIIDDNEMTRAMLRMLLFGAGHRVAGEAGTGRAGYEQVIKLTPDLVFLDIQMPDISGIEILKQLKQTLPKTIVLMVSGQRDVLTIKSCLSNGASGFIVKPFNAVTVMKSLKDALLRA